jgi:decaprenylphospho-beta-D-ribofuranose 2-oxidase
MDKGSKLMISGWGRNIWSSSREVLGSEELGKVKEDVRGAIPIGLGRSYGDSALNSNGIRIDSSPLKSIKRLEDTNVFRCGAGVTIGELSRAAIPLGLYPFVVPGTEFVTIGGATAGDIHGKSHHRVGSFSKKIQRIKLLLSDGQKLEIRPDGETADLFNATIGGLGLTGFILEVDIELMPINCSEIDVIEKRAHDLAEVLDILSSEEENYFYSVAWIDLSGRYSGRGRVTFGNHCTGSHDVTERTFSRDQRVNRKSIPIRSFFGVNLVSHFFVRIFNSIWYWKPLTISKVSVEKFMHPLDGVRNWNVLYGRKGFVQYQFVVPREHAEFLIVVLDKLKELRVGSPLGVLKQLGEESDALLGFAKPGWTLAVDIPAGVKGIANLLRFLDKELVELGGRVYLVKDSRMSSDVVPKMYPLLDQWRIVKKAYDSTNLWQSDQSRRLEL